MMTNSVDEVRGIDTVGENQEALYMNITHKGNLVHVTPVPQGLPAILTGQFSSRETVPIHDEYGNVIRTKVTYPVKALKVYHMARNGTFLIVPSGMLPRIRAFARHAKIPITYVGERLTLPPADLSSMPSSTLRIGQPEMLAGVLSCTRGRHKAPAGLGKSFIVGVICAILPDIKILICSPNISVNNGLYRETTKYVGESQVRRIYGKFGKLKSEIRKDERVIITTNASLHKIDKAWPDLVIVDECHQAGSPQVYLPLMQFTNSCIHGMSATPTGRGDSADIIVEALFGPNLTNVNYQEGVQAGAVAQMRVIAVDINIGTIKADLRKEVEHVGYYWNDVRTKALVDARNYFVPADISTLYYCATLEHCLRLQKLYLPNVPIAHSGVTKARWADLVKTGIVTAEEYPLYAKCDTDALEQQLRDGIIPAAICTPTWRQGTDFSNLGCLVRFDGQSSSILAEQIPGRAGRIGSDGNKNLGYLVDCTDNFGPNYRRRWCKRVKVYRENGWEIKLV